jgi:preprotein translocase subunit SecA
MAQRDPLVEYQREGFALYQSMMGQIREESVGFLFNLEVEVTGQEGVAGVSAKGLGEAGNPTAALSYSAPSADAAGEVEVRNQRGQIERAATAKAQQAAAQQAAAQGGQQAAEAPQQAPTRGAFGQKVDPNAPVAGNRAERRAAERKGN